MRPRRPPLQFLQVSLSDWVALERGGRGEGGGGGGRRLMVLLKGVAGGVGVVFGAIRVGVVGASSMTISVIEE